MKASLGFGERVDGYVKHTTSAMKRTPRRANTSYPKKISDLVKSASKVDIIKDGYPSDAFLELSDISGVSTHVILKREGNTFVIQDTSDSIREITMQRDNNGGLVVGYQGEVYNEFDRSGNVYSHSVLLAQDIKRYGSISVDQGLMTEQELQYDIWRALTHDALSETEISDMESRRKTPAWRAYEEKTEKRMIAKHFPEDQQFVQWLLGYDKKSPFKTADRIQATLDVFHMMCHPESKKRNYANRIGTSYEVALNGLARLTCSDQAIQFAQKSRHPLQVQALLQQIKDQGVGYFPQFLEMMKQEQSTIGQQIRYGDKYDTGDIGQGIDAIEKNMNTINDAVAKL